MTKEIYTSIKSCSLLLQQVTQGCRGGKLGEIPSVSW